MRTLPDSGVRGLKSFDAQMMRAADGTSMMVTNDVFRMYFGYVTICRNRGREPQSFGLWISAMELTESRGGDASGVVAGA